MLFAATASGCLQAGAYRPGVIPTALEGIRLGGDFARAVARLEAEGWSVRREVRKRHGVAVRHIQAVRRDHPIVEGVRLGALGGRVAAIRLIFTLRGFARGREIARCCDAHNTVAGGGYYVQCVDGRRQRSLTARREGSRATLVDLGAAVAAGLIGRSELAARVARSTEQLGRAMAGRHDEAARGESPPAAPLPRSLEGFALGERLRDAMARLGRWRVRLRGRIRRGIPYRQVTAIPPTPTLRLLKLDAHHGRVLRIRAYYRSEDSARADQLRRACAGHVSVVGRLGYVACRDRAWRTLRSAAESGVYVQVLDAGAVLRAGLATRREIDVAAAP